MAHIGSFTADIVWMAANSGFHTPMKLANEFSALNPVCPVRDTNEILVAPASPAS